MSGEPKEPRTWRALAIIGAAVVVAGTLAVTVAAFTLSYDAIRSVGIAANTRPSWAWMLPVSIDGAMGVATVAVLLLKQLGRSTWYPWVVVAVGVLVSGGCNGLHAGGQDGRVDLPGEWARAVGVIPPLMLALSVHLLAVLVKALSGSGRTEPVRSAPAAGSAEQALAPAPSPMSDRPRAEVPEQTEQVGQASADRVPDSELNRPPASTDSQRTGQTEQAPTDEPVRHTLPRTARTEQALELGKQSGRVAKQTGGQEAGQDSEQGKRRPRSDEELIAIVRAKAAEKIANRTLTRYDVEKLTQASSRQANRVRAAVLTGSEQTEQTEPASAIRAWADTDGADHPTTTTQPIQDRIRTGDGSTENRKPPEMAGLALDGPGSAGPSTDPGGQGEADESPLQVSITVGAGVGGSV